MNASQRTASHDTLVAGNSGVTGDRHGQQALVVHKPFLELPSGKKKFVHHYLLCTGWGGGAGQQGTLIATCLIR